jgi:hypothetical protein
MLRHEAKMISEIAGVEERLAMESWRDVQNQTDIDPDSDLTDLVPALGRLLGWLAEGDTCERRGMRVLAVLVVVRPDFIEEKSLGQMSRGSKRLFDELVNDFRSTFTLRSDRRT